MNRLFLSLLFLAPLLAEGQTPIVIGQQFEIESAILGETRSIQVYDPGSSQSGAAFQMAKASYPVIYLLDGPGHFHHTTGVVQFLVQQGKMPNVIVVGVANTDRTRDLTPPTSMDPNGNFPTAGGADNFLRFLSDELAPFIEANYNAAPYRLLIGHSFGGLFAVHALISRPDVFDAYLAISPSLWWNDQEQVKQAEAFLSSAEDLSGDLYMTLGNEGGPMFGGVMKLTDILKESAPESFRWDFALMETETHGTVPHRSTYDGLEKIFSDFWLPNPMALFQEGGMEALDEHFAGLTSRFGYSIPTPEALVNQIGYTLIGQERLSDAIALFERNVADFPESSNVYDSLGEAYLARGDTQLAIDNYQKSLDLNPANSNATQVLARLRAEPGDGG